jgi:hypothetical protein
VRTAGWKREEVDAVKHEIDLALQETEQGFSARRSKKGSNSGTEPLIFFLGEPMEGDPMAFAVDHPRAVCSFSQKYQNLGGDPDPQAQGAASGHQRVTRAPTPRTQVSPTTRDASAPSSAPRVERVSSLRSVPEPPADTKSVSSAPQVIPRDDARVEPGKLDGESMWRRLRRRLFG